MGYIPIFLDVTGRECVVVGGGEVAARKVESILEAGAHVTVVSPSLSPPMKAIVAQEQVTHIARDYQRGDIRGCVLVYAATDDPKLHRELAAEARTLGIPITSPMSQSCAASSRPPSLSAVRFKSQSRPAACN